MSGCFVLTIHMTTNIRRLISPSRQILTLFPAMVGPLASIGPTSKPSPAFLISPFRPLCSLEGGIGALGKPFLWIELYPHSLYQSLVTTSMVKTFFKANTKHWNFSVGWGIDFVRGWGFFILIKRWQNYYPYHHKYIYIILIPTDTSLLSKIQFLKKTTVFKFTQLFINTLMR